MESWGETVKETNAVWASYTQEERATIIAEAENIYAELSEHIGTDPSSDAVQKLMTQWHENLRYFFEPSIETLAGLAELYLHNNDFHEKFEDISPGLTDFFHQSIAEYVDRLETQWLERELGILSE